MLGFGHDIHHKARCAKAIQQPRNVSTTMRESAQSIYELLGGLSGYQYNQPETRRSLWGRLQPAVKTARPRKSILLSQVLPPNRKPHRSEAFMMPDRKAQRAPSVRECRRSTNKIAAPR